MPDERMGSTPPFITWAPLETVERYHEENKREHRAIEDRIATLENHKTEVNGRLSSGAQAFEDFRKTVDELRLAVKDLHKQINWPFWKVVVLAAGLLGGGGGILVAVAKGPTGSDVEKIRNQVDDLRIQDALHQRSNAELKVSVESLNVKVDALLRRP